MDEYFFSRLQDLSSTKQQQIMVAFILALIYILGARFQCGTLSVTHLCSFAAFSIRLFSVLRFENIIHEVSPNVA